MWILNSNVTIMFLHCFFFVGTLFVRRLFEKHSLCFITKIPVVYLQDISFPLL